MRCPAEFDKEGFLIRFSDSLSGCVLCGFVRADRPHS